MMKIKRLLKEKIGDMTVLLEAIEGDPGLHDYGIPRRAWMRALKIMKHYGPESSLEIIDDRAERAADRRDFETSRRWRELITAIHAMTEESPLPGDNIH